MAADVHDSDELDDRKASVLRAVVEQYIGTAQPVGSGALVREAGLGVVDAVLRTAAQRLRPVLLTTVTTILGLVPMALQVTVNFFGPSINVGGITSIWWVQLSTAVIFGLGFATLLTLILVPTLLVAPTIYGQRLARLSARFGRGRGAKTAAGHNAPPARSKGKSAPAPAGETAPGAAE